MCSWDIQGYREDKKGTNTVMISSEGDWSGCCCKQLIRNISNDRTLVDCWWLQWKRDISHCCCVVENRICKNSDFSLLSALCQVTTLTLFVIISDKTKHHNVQSHNVQPDPLSLNAWCSGILHGVWGGWLWWERGKNLHFWRISQLEQHLSNCCRWEKFKTRDYICLQSENLIFEGNCINLRLLKLVQLPPKLSVFSFVEKNIR